MSGAIPAELGDLTNLQYLYLWGNNLSGAIPAELGDLTSLLVLDLARNNLSGEIPAELGDLASLWSLFLWGNKLSGEIPAELGDLTNLFDLSLAQNKLDGEIPEELGDLTNLEILYLNDNELDGEIPEELGNLANLQRLSLSENGLSGSIPTEMGILSNLTQLYLRDNELSGPIPTEMGNLSNLTQLSLSRNKLTGPIPAELADLTNLQELYLNGNADLTGPLPLGLMNLNALTTVWIQDTGLCAPEDAAFRTWAAAIADFKGCGGPPPPQPATPPPPPPPPPRPDAPENLLVEGGDGQVTLTWAAPEDDGGSAIIDYEYRIDGKGRWISIGSTDTTHTVTGLVNGQVYVFQVRAVNRNRKGRASGRVEATPRMPVALDFTHFANGTGITSGLVFVNLSTQPTQPTFYFYGQEGHLIDPESVVDIMDDLMVTEDGALTVQTAMEPLGELTITTHGQGELVSGSVKVVADGPIGGGLRFDIPGLGVAGVGASKPVHDVAVPGAPPGRAGINTGVSPPQPGSGSDGGELPVDARGRRARRGGDSPGGQRANLLVHRRHVHRDRYVRLRGIGALHRIRGRGRFTVIAMEIDAAGGIFTTLPVVEVNRGRAESTTLDFAHFANGTWITDLVFVNLETRQSGPRPHSLPHRPSRRPDPLFISTTPRATRLPPNWWWT